MAAVDCLQVCEGLPHGPSSSLMGKLRPGCPLWSRTKFPHARPIYIESLAVLCWGPSCALQDTQEYPWLLFKVSAHVPWVEGTHFPPSMRY